MNGFIKECRREWKRLGVPDSVANEMAADLAADLQEAESEGASPEDVLGSSAFDPRSFAAAWATERGVVPSGPAPAGLSRRSLILSAAVALAVMAVIGGALALFASNSDHLQVVGGSVTRSAAAVGVPGPWSVQAGGPAPFQMLRRIVTGRRGVTETIHLPGPGRRSVQVLPAPRGPASVQAIPGPTGPWQAIGAPGPGPASVQVTPAPGQTLALPAPDLPPLLRARFAAGPPGASGFDARTFGLILFIVGAAGAILATLLLLWSPLARRSAQRAAAL